jgi:L-alanine-DL-glutamate epimerase-like enolase superfamily enzyme
VPAGIRDALESDGEALLGDDLFALEAISRRLASWDGPQGAKMALDGALHDWLGRRVGQPLRHLLGTDRLTPPTSYTIGIDTVAGTADRARRAGGYQVLKVKVGGPGDLERLRAVRAESAARIRIDGNEGWDLDTARELTGELIELGVEFVEQPFPADDLDAFHAYRALSLRLPVLIDEGCRDLGSVAAIAAYADGIVIKLSKCGGIREALRMIHAARALGLKVMLGCMIESELGIAQAAQLGSLADYVDLDGHLLISSQPFRGLGLEDGRLVLSDGPGLGVE